jgi:hypothetical protein
MQPPSKATPKHLLPDIRVLTIHDVDYFVDWSKLPVGASFFLPTVASPKQVTEALKPFTQKLDYEFEVHARCEYGRYGARVWRVY